MDDLIVAFGLFLFIEGILYALFPSKMKSMLEKLKMINDFFNWCVFVLEVIGDVTGMGYELANIVIFVIIQPSLILLFYILWRREKRKNNL